MAENKKTGTVLEAIRGISFPATHEDLVKNAEARGIEAIEWGAHEPIPLRVIFNRYQHLTFLNEDDVVRAVSNTEDELGRGLE